MPPHPEDLEEEVAAKMPESHYSSFGFQVISDELQRLTRERERLLNVLTKEYPLPPGYTHWNLTDSGQPYAARD